MSDPKSSYGEPVEEPATVDDDVVGRAHEGLADAEVARGEAVAEPVTPAPAAAEPAAEPAFVEPVTPEPAYVEPAYVEPAYVEPVVDDATVAYERAETVAAAPVVTPSEPVDETEYVPGMYSNPAAVAPVVAAPAVAAVAPQPIFVQAPEAPLPRGNRAAAGAIGLLAAVAFAVLYLAAWLGFGAIAGTVTIANVGTTALAALGTWSLWVTVAVFFIAFWLLGAIVNRGRWGVWVNVGLLVGVASYGGHLLGQLFQAPFWSLTASQGSALVESQLLAPLAIAAFIIGRELTIWFGAWAAARGRRVTELNLEAQREYERTLEAGPQLVRQ